MKKKRKLQLKSSIWTRFADPIELLELHSQAIMHVISLQTNRMEDEEVHCITDEMVDQLIQMYESKDEDDRILMYAIINNRDRSNLNSEKNYKIIIQKLLR